MSGSESTTTTPVRLIMPYTTPSNARPSTPLSSMSPRKRKCDGPDLPRESREMSRTPPGATSKPKSADHTGLQTCTTKFKIVTAIEKHLAEVEQQCNKFFDLEATHPEPKTMHPQLTLNPLLIKDVTKALQQFKMPVKRMVDNRDDAERRSKEKEKDLEDYVEGIEWNQGRKGFVNFLGVLERAKLNFGFEGEELVEFVKWFGEGAEIDEM